MFKQLAKIRIEKKSPFLVRKSKLFSWLLTIIPVLMFIATIGLAIFSIINLITIMSSIESSGDSSNIQNIKNHALSIIDGIRVFINYLNISCALFFSSFIVFFVVKLIATTLNMTRYGYDYKLNVVPVKSILITRIVLQTLISLLLIGILMMFLVIVKNFLTINPLSTISNIIDDTYKSIQTSNGSGQEIQTIFDNMTNEINKYLDEVFINNNFNGYQYIFTLLILFFFGWIFVLIIYGITIKIMLSKNKKHFGRDDLKIVKEKSKKHDENKKKEDQKNKDEEKKLEENKDTIKEENK